MTLTKVVAHANFAETTIILWDDNSVGLIQQPHGLETTPVYLSSETVIGIFELLAKRLVSGHFETPINQKGV